MQTAHLNQLNVHFAYLDSGEPHSTDYTTLVCMHGNTYHAKTFQRLLPLVAQHNIRLIALNRRDYLGSSPFDESELAALRSTDEPLHKQFLFDRGLEIAHFFLWLVNELGIPPARNNHKTGGIALLGWSLGNITAFAFLSNFAKYPKEITQILEKYLRHFLIYEAVYQFLGLPSPEGAYHPLWDDTIPFEQRPAVINDWFTSYFTHLCFTPDACIHDFRLLQLRIPENPIKPSTSTNRTAEEFAEITDHSPIMRSEIAFYTTVRESTLHDQYVAALTSGKKQTCSSSTLPLPDLEVTVIDGTQTVWNIIWTTWEMQKDLDRWTQDGIKVRPIDFVTIEGSNHYCLWDNPELLMKTLASSLGQ